MNVFFVLQVRRTMLVSNIPGTIKPRGTLCYSRTNHARSPRAFIFRQLTSGEGRFDAREFPTLPEVQHQGDELNPESNSACYVGVWLAIQVQYRIVGRIVLRVVSLRQCSTPNE